MGKGRKWGEEAQCPHPTPGSSITIAGASQGLAQPRSPGHQGQKWSSVLGRAKGMSVEGGEVNGDRQAYRAGSPQAGGLHQHRGPQSSVKSADSVCWKLLEVALVPAWEGHWPRGPPPPPPAP